MNRTNRIADLSMIWKQVSMIFPYFDQRKIDWDSAYLEYLSKVLHAETDRDFHLLLAEFTAEFLSETDLSNDKLPGNVKAIIEWIRVHYEQQITVASLAEHFNYHPTYLTALMKKYTGHTVSYYITLYRITAAKNLLTAPPPKYSTKSIAYMCGFKDEKYFLRIFKKMEGMTPGQYRNAFNEKKLNRK